MNPDLLIDNFFEFADAPNGVQKLRDLILRMGVTGRLLPQRVDEGSALELLRNISAEKARLAKKTLSKVANPVRRSLSKDHHCTLPSSWTWVAIEDVFYTISSSKKKIKTSLIEQSGKYPVVDQGQRFIAGYIDDPSLVIKIPGPIVVFGDHTCELKFIDFDFVAGADGVRVLRPIGVWERYFYLVLKTFNFEEKGYSRHYKFLVNHQFPLAPLNEQHRIVTKVDELMALCDELEKRQEKKHQVSMALNESALNRLTTATTPQVFTESWQRIKTNFDLLFDNTENVEKLKQAILQLAARGKLIPQDSKDEPASALLARIKTERERLAMKKNLKPSKPLPPISAEEVQFELPNGWVWCRLGELQVFINGFAFPSSAYQSSGVGVVRIGDIQDGQIVTSEMKYVDPVFLKEIDYRFQVKPGAMLIAMSGATTGKVGFNRTAETFMLNQRVGKLEVIEIDPLFAYFYLNTKVHENLRISSGSAIPNLSTEQINMIVFPLAPADEQSRIVKKVKDLMSSCEELEEKLRRSETGTDRLMDALVTGVTRVE